MHTAARLARMMPRRSPVPRKPQPKTNAQVRRMFGLAKPLADKAQMDTHAYLSVVAFEATREQNSSISQLSFDEANAVIKALGGDPFTPRGNSVRAQNYRKQQAGIKSIETENHLNFIDELARLRNMTPEGVAKLATRMNLPYPPRTTEQGNKIVEALKAMNKRDGIGGQPSVVSGQPEPTFRRVA
jgi:hypothetical protein